MRFKLLHCSDWHLSETSSVPITVQLKNVTTPVNVRTIDTFKRIKTMVNYAIQNHVKFFVIAGDIYDKPITAMYIKKWFARYISKLLKNKIKVIIVIGNHDSDGNENAFSDIKEYLDNTNGLYIVDKYRKIKFKNIDFFCVPYDSEMDIKGLLTSHKLKYGKDLNKINVLIGHLGAMDSVIGNTEMSSSLISEVDTMWMTGYDYVALGDYHIHQKIGSARVKKANDIWYSGSIIRLNMGEPEKKYFNVVTFDSNNHSHNVKPILLPDREFVTIKISYDEMKNFIKSTKTIKYNIKEGDVVKFVSETTAKKAMIIEPKFIAKINRIYKPLSTSIKWAYTAVTKKRSDGFDLGIDAIHAMEKYLKDNKTTLDYKELMKLHKEIVKEYGHTL